jgi:outer membrane protein assembly factor BamB
VYVSTVPVNPAVGVYLGGGKATLWALNAATGAPEWSWDEVQNLWGKPGINGSTTFAAVNDLPLPMNATGRSLGSAAATIQAVFKATGEMVAVNQDTGKIEWDTRLPSSPYGAATVTNNVVFTTTFHGDLYALNAATGAILLKTPLSAGSNAPVAIDGRYVIAGAGAPLSAGQHPLIIAYRLGATGRLPDTVGP